jgi:type I restriction enzyme S subunit
LDTTNSSDVSIEAYPRSACITFRKTAERFGGLSNMAPGFRLRINGATILTAEALYQACRFPHDPALQRMIIEQSSPMTAKMKSKPHRARSRSDWDAVRVEVMRWCLRIKLAQNWATFGPLLESTGDQPIVEESPRDPFWGARPDDENQVLVGRNVLGRLLMELRARLRAHGELLRTVDAPAITEMRFLGRDIGRIGPEREPEDTRLRLFDVETPGPPKGVS